MKNFEFLKNFNSEMLWFFFGAFYALITIFSFIKIVIIKKRKKKRKMTVVQSPKLKDTG